MNATIKEHWLSEMLLGNYLPNKSGFLATRARTPWAPIRYSPLGVLCEIARAANVPVVRQAQHSQWLPYEAAIAYNNELICLPASVREWAEIGGDGNYYIRWDGGHDWHRGGIMNIAYLHKQLASNSFQEIAALIAEHY